MKYIKVIISTICILMGFSLIVVNGFITLLDPESMSIVYLLPMAILINVTKIPKSLWKALWPVTKLNI